jgi:uridine kinase
MANDLVEKTEVADALRRLRAQIRARTGRVLVAVDGVDGSGKTTFADDLAELLRESGIEVIRISLDDYLNPQNRRYAQGRYSPKGFFEDSYDYERFNAEVLEPLSRDGSGRYRTAAYDRGAECEVCAPWQVAPDSAVVIVDGMFMHRREFCTDVKRKVWQLSVWLEAPVEVTLARLAERDGTSADPADERNQRYLHGQRLYIETCDPASKADLVVVNAAPHQPFEE